MRFENKLKYQITLTGSSNGGYIIRMGCAEFTFPTIAVLLDALKEYLEDPIKVNQEYAKTFGYPIEQIGRPCRVS